MIKKLRKITPFIDGSTVKTARTCGNKEHCHCLTGDKHESYYLTYKEKQKTVSIYIPVDIEAQVQQWAKEYRRLKEIVKEVCRLQKAIIKNYVKEKNRGRKGKKL